MAKVAKSDLARIRIGANTYEFKDGERQVTEAEAQELDQSAYDVTIHEQKTGKEKS